ncbi:hypothetical protein ABT369_39840 [Dactylosporangium sp. NPDC000244]|uniref:hypothetical protein n=1 Tax=Dactylosporangium sp. NPDC000244 TaxID=3154365 RepID=UPI003316A83B
MPETITLDHRPDAASVEHQPPVPVVADDEHEFVPAALRRLRDAARNCCHIAARNGSYPADLAVAVLADTTAALTELAGWVAPYAGDFWPTAGGEVDVARTALTAARGHLDAARHHIDLVPAQDDSVTAVV